MRGVRRTPRAPRPRRRSRWRRSGAQKSREQRQILVRKDRGGRVERVVEHHHPGAGENAALERLSVKRQSGGCEVDEARDAAGARARAADRRRTSAGTAPPRRPGRPGEDARRQRLRRAGGDHDLGVRDRGRGPGSAGNARPRPARSSGRPIIGGYWFQPSRHRLRRLAPDVLRTRVVGKALAEIDRARLAGEARHDLENGGRKVGENRVHARLLQRVAHGRVTGRWPPRAVRIMPRPGWHPSSPGPPA